MEGKTIKWGNLIIFLLIIAAGIVAFIYKNPDKFDGIRNIGKNRTGTESEVMKNDFPLQDNIATSDKFIVGLDSWIGGTPVLVALDREYNKDYLLDMKVEFIPNDIDRIIALKDGIIHVTEMSLPAFVRFQNQYPDSGMIIGITDFSRGADGIIAKSDVKTLNDMEDRTVSFVAGGTGKFILNKFLRLTGLRYQDIKPIERNEMGEVVEDLKSGRADLIVSWSPDMNLAVKDINSAKPDSVKTLITTKEVPNLVPTVIVVNKSVAEKYPEKVEAFIKTWYASAKYIIEKPDRAYEKLASLMTEKNDVYGNIDKDEVKESFVNIKLMSLNDNFEYFGQEGTEKKLTGIISDTVKTWQKYGDMPETNIPENIISYSFMDNIYKENDEDLLIGALDSAITGNSQQPAEVKKEFELQDDVSIEKNTEKVVKVDIPMVYYDSGKSTVKAESLVVLDEVFGILKQFPEYYLIIDAHTDSVGSDESNLKLSKDRAVEVKSYLLSQGVDTNRIVARGWGEYRLLISDEKTGEDRAKNRRTEFLLSRDITSR